jgi:hypothetical protein
MEQHPQPQTTPKDLSILHAIRHHFSQGTNLRPGTRSIEEFAQPTLDEIPKPSPFYNLNPGLRNKLATSSIRLVHRLGALTNTELTDPKHSAEVAHEASGDVIKLMAADWTGDVAVRLALRHHPDDIQTLLEEYASHPIWTRRQCMHYMGVNTNNPRETLQAVVDFFGHIRVNERLLCITNNTIAKTTPVTVMRARDYSSARAAEAAIHKPLDSDPETGLAQLRSIHDIMGNLASRNNKNWLQTYVANVVNNDPEVIELCEQTGITPEECKDFVTTYALYADNFDYDAVIDSSLLPALTTQYLKESRALHKMGVPMTLALKAVLREDGSYFTKMFAEAKKNNVSPGLVNQLITNWSGDCLKQLRSLCAIRDEMGKFEPTLSDRSRFMLALKAATGSKTAKEIIDEYNDVVGAALLLFGSSLTKTFIRATFISMPVGGMKYLEATKKLADAMYEKYHDPCMPAGFILRFVERSSRKALEPTLKTYHTAVQDIRNQNAQASDYEIWELLKAHCDIKKL